MLVLVRLGVNSNRVLGEDDRKRCKLVFSELQLLSLSPSLSDLNLLKTHLKVFFFTHIYFNRRILRVRMAPAGPPPSCGWSYLRGSLPAPALLAGRGQFVHQGREFEQSQFLQQRELGHRLVLHPRTGGGGQALLAAPVLPPAGPAGEGRSHKNH